VKNQLVARILNEVADQLEMRGVEFKPQAYRRAARTVEALAQPIEQIYAKGKLEELPGIGASIAKKIAEIIDTESLSYYEELKKKSPVKLDELLSVEGIGPKTAGLLYKRLGITSIDELEKAAKLHRIRDIKGLGQKTEENVLAAIGMARSRGQRALLDTAYSLAESVRKRLESKTLNVEVAGSLRRMKETVGDLDIVAATEDPRELAGVFTKMPNVTKVLESGETKSSVLIHGNVQVDLRIINKNSFGTALMYFTGSKDHNIALRKIAIERGLKLNEYGLFKKDTMIAGRTEEEVYRKLGLSYIPPELREDQGEISAAKENKLPNLIQYDSIRGDLQSHSTWSDGHRTIEEMARAAQAVGYSYIAITDHYSPIPIVHGLNERRLKEQSAEIDKANDKLRGIRILKGAEVDISPDGNLTAENNALQQLDLVVASVHSAFKQTRREMTNRIIAAMENEHVKIIGHPTSRKINRKNPCDMDMEAIFDASKRTKTYLEVNASPQRLDLSDANTRLALKAGCKVAVNTDAHDEKELLNMRFGIGVARRGWATQQDVVNTSNLDGLMQLLKK
ncbi:MAG TPA: DNA polymerase/3'-5' exonuclease PolX, partial [Terriglobales bacterium]|nr:DNA polymerase/3'-5' exonuclease PolX [Terriglobales bacterium]